MQPSDLKAPHEDWTSIKVVAAFGGLRFLPWWWGTSSNSANPVLEIGAEGIRYRALILKQVEYARIELVDLRTAWRTVNLCFRFHDAVGTFAANVRYLEEAARALRLLNNRVPLGSRARQVAELTQT